MASYYDQDNLFTTAFLKEWRNLAPASSFHFKMVLHSHFYVVLAYDTQNVNMLKSLIWFV